MTTFSQFKQKLLDGRYRWGHVSCRSGRYGAESIRLVIYPPNTSVAERRCARLVRLWPGISIGLITLNAWALTALTDVPIFTTVMLLILLVVTIRIVIGNIANRVTARSIELFATVSGISPDETDCAGYERIAQIADDLHNAEHCFDHEDIPLGKYRAIWAEIYCNALKGA